MLCFIHIFDKVDYYKKSQHIVNDRFKFAKLNKNIPENLLKKIRQQTYNEFDVGPLKHKLSTFLNDIMKPYLPTKYCITSTHQ